LVDQFCQCGVGAFSKVLACRLRNEKTLDHVEEMMKMGEKLFKFLTRLILDKCHETVTIRFESAKLTDVGTATRPMWKHRDLPDQASGPPFGTGRRHG